MSSHLFISTRLFRKHLLFPPKFIQVFARSIALSSSSVKINSQEKETLSNSLLLFTSENSDLSPAKLSNVVRIYTHSFHRHASTNASISKPTHSSLSSTRSSIYDHDFIHLEILEIFHLSSFLEFRLYSATTASATRRPAYYAIPSASKHVIVLLAIKERKRERERERERATAFTQALQCRKVVIWKYWKPLTLSWRLPE